MIIFDLDGTLLNTIDDLGQACNYALQQGGYPTHSAEEYKLLVGNGVRRLLYRALPANARDEETINRLLGYFKAFYNDHCCDFTFPYDGMTQLVAELQQAHIPIAVASNKYQQAAEKIVTHYFGPDIRVYGQQENIPIKPDPQVIYNIMKDHGITNKQKVILVGDSNVDIQTARNAEITSIGVSWGFRGRQELTEAGADYVVDNINQLRLIILNHE